MSANFPKTLTELATSTKPHPVGVLRKAAEIASEMNDHEIWAELFATAAEDAETELAYAPVPDSRGLEHVWVHNSGSCGPIDECPCTLGAVLKASLAFVNVEIDAGAVTP